MSDHKFKAGETVFLEWSIVLPGGAYEVTKRLPERNGEFEYRVNGAGEPYERVVRESQLSATLQLSFSTFTQCAEPPLLYLQVLLRALCASPSTTNFASDL